MEKLKIIYDIAACPTNVTIDQIAYVMNNTGMILYDSSKGKTPEIIGEEKLYLYDVKYIDTATLEEKFQLKSE